MAIAAMSTAADLARRGEHPDRLDRVQRDAVGPCDDRRPATARQVGRERLEDLAHRVVGQRLEGEPDERPLTAAPARSALDQLWPGQRDDRHRHARAPVEHVVDEVEQAGIGPMEILEQEDDGSGRGDPLEERSPRTEQFLARRPRAALESEKNEEGVLDPATLALVGDPAGDAGGDGGPCGGFVVALDQPDPAADHLAERPERDALAVRRRATGVPVDRVDQAVDVLGQLPRHPALADAGHAGDRHEARALVAGRGQDDLAEEAELVVAADERRLDLVGPAAAATLGHDPDGAKCGHRRDLALEDLVAGGLEGDGRIRRLLGLLADEDGARRGHALQARRGVDDVAGNEALVGRADGHRRLPGQDAGACLDPGTKGADAVDQVERGADRPFRVVVVGDRRAPDGHHRVADELLDRAAVPADDVLALLEVARQELAHGFGVAAFGERRESDEIGEQDGHEAPFGDACAGSEGGRFGHGTRAAGRAGRRRRDRGPALGAEPGTGDERRTASGT